MNMEEFINYIESIGFNYNNDSNCYEYMNYRIVLYNDSYDFSIDKKWKLDISYNNSVWIEEIPYNDLSQIQDRFKKELRTYKLNQLLK